MSAPRRQNIVLGWLRRLWDRERRLFGGIGAAIDPNAAPLEFTQVRREEFSLALPGVWRERRAANGLELIRDDGLERVSVQVKKLVAPVAAGALSAIVERVLDDQGRHATNQAAEPLHWREADYSPRGLRLEARQWGCCLAGRLHVALLVRAGEQRILSAALVSRNIAGELDRAAAQTAFVARAAVIFDRLQD